MKLQLWSCVNSEPNNLLAEMDISAKQWAFACTNRHAAHHLIQQLKEAMK